MEINKNILLLFLLRSLFLVLLSTLSSENGVDVPWS
jgi:hypothetical protein